MTKEGFDRLNAELNELEDKILPAIVAEVSRARGNGDLSENAEYHAAKSDQRNAMRKIGYLKDFKVNAQVVDCSNLTNDTVKFGSHVEILDLDTDKKKKIRLVGDYEADITHGLISIVAPLGKALLGKKVGDSFEVETPAGISAYEVVRIGKLWTALEGLITYLFIAKKISKHL